MKRITFLSLALVIGFCLQSHSGFAQDQDQNKKDTKEAKGSHHGDKGTPQVGRQVQKGDRQAGTFQSGKVSSGSISNNVEGSRPSKISAQRSGDVIHQSVQQTSRRSFQKSQNQSGSYPVQGNRSDHYGGQWSEASVHSDWNRNGEHEWNHHHYRWYDGGWLIVEAGPSPADYQTGSIESNVQQKLAEQGYYNGPIDGDIGPGTRHAIAHYQDDQGLRVNGRIDGPLLASLGLE